LRILPVYLGFISVLAGLQLFTLFRQRPEVWIGNLTFTTNYCDGIAAGDFTSGHLWSLSVEEQFYLVWPGLFLLFGVATRMRSAAVVLGLPLVAAPICRVLTYKHFYPRAFSVFFMDDSFLNYFDSLAVGCACAVLLARRGDALRTWLGARPRLIQATALVLILVSKVQLGVPGRIVMGLGPTLQASGIAILLLQSVLFPDSGFYRSLNWFWVRRIGVLSYSLYIWQELFCTDPKVLGLGPVWWMTFPGWLVPTFLVATISYYGFERPLLRLRARFRGTCPSQPTCITS
jgi:peptidoglycan/LPS O-acetylase OafA/YrhL